MGQYDRTVITSGSLLPSHSMSCSGKEAIDLLGILLPDSALGKGLLRGKPLWDKCLKPHLSSQSSGHTVGRADDLLCSSVSLAALFHSDALLETPASHVLWKAIFFRRLLNIQELYCEPNAGCYFLILTVPWVDTGTHIHNFLLSFPNMQGIVRPSPQETEDEQDRTQHLLLMTSTRHN